MPPFSTITVKQLMVLKNCSESTAGRLLQRLRNSLNIEDVEARHLAVYWDCTVQELADALLPRFKK